MNKPNIPLEQLSSFLGKRIHIAKLNYQYTLELVALTSDNNGETWMHLESPQKRKPYKFKAKHAQYLRKDIPQGGNLND